MYRIFIDVLDNFHKQLNIEGFFQRWKYATVHYKNFKFFISELKNLFDILQNEIISRKTWPEDYLQIKKTSD